MATDFVFLPVTSGEQYFISYNTEDADRVRPIAQALHHAGVPLWYDYGLEYGKEWEIQIARAIHGAKAVILFITDGVFRKERSYVRKEFGIAESYKVKIIPVVLDNINAGSLPEHSIGWWMDIRSLHCVQCAPGEKAEQTCARVMYALGVAQKADSAVPANTSAYSSENTMSASAMNTLGEDYYYGSNGKPQDYVEAVKWYRAAAEQGDATAQCNLGVCYGKGQGVPQNYTEAVKWYRAAAEQGEVAAQNNLGVCYGKGQGVLQNYTEAAKWFRKAAEQGNADGQTNFGVCYLHSRGVPQDYAEAAKWFRKAAEQGHADGQNGLGWCYVNGQGVPQDCAEAVKWYRAAAGQGNAAAQFNLGVCYANGQGVPQSYAEAVKWYSKAAEQGDADAKKALARMIK